MTPTARSLTYLRRLGYLPAVVESWVPHANLRRDLFGFADVLAVHPRDKLFLLVQVTTAGHLAGRLAKAKRRPELAAWLRAGGRFEVHGWEHRAGRWQVRRVEVHGPALADVVLCVPRPRPSLPHAGCSLMRAATDRPSSPHAPRTHATTRASRPARRRGAFSAAPIAMRNSPSNPLKAPAQSRPWMPASVSAHRTASYSVTPSA
jgi:hypothetical protein